jgi:HK97 family phage prohead protease
VKILKNNELRYFSNIELREVGTDKQIHLQGYALKFDEVSEDLGFREIIKSGALDKTDMSNVILNFNHDSSKILARNNKQNGIGSLLLTVDDKGLLFDAIPTDTTYAKDLVENMRQGIIGKCSFAFSMDYNDNEAQTWEWNKNNMGYDLRTINKISSIVDVSIVTSPAYEGTESNVYTRAKEVNTNESLKIKEQLELRSKRLLIELEL